MRMTSAQRQGGNCEPKIQSQRHADEREEEGTLPLPLFALLEQEGFADAEDVHLELDELGVRVGREDLLDAVRVVLWDRDGEERVVEYVLEREDVAVDDEGRDAPRVDRFERSCGPGEGGRG